MMAVLRIEGGRRRWGRDGCLSVMLAGFYHCLSLFREPYVVDPETAVGSETRIGRKQRNVRVYIFQLYGDSGQRRTS